MPRKKKKKEEPKVIPGLHTTCFICSKEITEEDCKKEPPNQPVLMNNIPGYVHRRCRGQTEMRIVQNPVTTQNVQHEADSLI
jgi:hypothetical protein